MCTLRYNLDHSSELFMFPLQFEEFVVRDIFQSFLIQQLLPLDTSIQYLVAQMRSLIQFNEEFIALNFCPVDICWCICSKPCKIFPRCVCLINFVLEPLARNRQDV